MRRGPARAADAAPGRSRPFRSIESTSVARRRRLRAVEGAVALIHSPRAGAAFRRAGRRRQRDELDRHRRDQRARRPKPPATAGQRVEAAGAAERRRAAGPRRDGCATNRRRNERHGYRTGMSWSARLLIGAGADPRRRRRGDLGPRALPAGGALPRHRAGRAASAARSAQPLGRDRADPRSAGTAADRRRSRSPRSKRASRGSRMRPQRAEGFAGRADALVVAFAARRAIDRGVALGYLENLLVDRFGAQHQAAVATIITASHQPVRLNDLIAEYETLGPELRRGGPQDSWWTDFRRELGSLIEVHPRRPARRPTPTRATTARCSASSPATSTRRWPKPCGCPARRARGDWIGQGAALRRRPPRARRDRIRGAARPAPTPSR